MELYLEPRTVGFIVVTVLFIVATAVIDCEHILKGEYIDDHKPRFIQRLSAFAMVSIFDFWYGLAGALLFASTFEQLLNLFRAKSFWYLGTKADWDIFWTKYKKLYIAIKILMFASSIYLFIKF